MITITNATKDILDDVTDEKIGTEEFKNFDIRFEDGAHAFGKIIKDVAYISGINAPKVNIIEPKRGTKTYERVLKELYNKGLIKVTINLQSTDSREAIKRLISNGILANPRHYTGLSIDEHPTTFDITNKINTIQLQENTINKMNITPILPKESYQTKTLNENKSVKPDFTSNNKKFVDKLSEALGKKINTTKPDLIENSGKSLDRLKQLFEYNVIEGKPFEPLYKETGFIGEEDPIPDPESVGDGIEVPTIEPETPTDTNVDSTDTPEDDNTVDLKPKSDPLSFEELTTKKVAVLKDIATVQKEKIDQIFDYIEVLGTEVEKLINKTQEIDVLNDKTIQMQDQIDFLTPDTAEESLDKMVRISGGYTIDDYWKTWLAKNQGKEVIGKIPYYQNGVTTNEPAQVKLPSYSDEQVKVSLGLK
jgi:hypothetical protein